MSDAEWGVLKTTAIQAGDFLPQHNKRLPATLEPRPHLEIKSGDLLLTSAGPRSRCGVVCMVKKTRPRLMISGKMYRFRFDENLVLPRYIEAYLQSHRAWIDIDKMKTGVSDSGLNLTQNRFRRLKIPLAPLAEQKRIVSAIEEHFTRLDIVKVTLDRGLQQLRTLGSSVLVEAFYSNRVMPAHWEWMKLGDVAEVRGGIQKQPKRRPRKNPAPFLRVANVLRDELQLDEVHQIELFDGEFEKYRLLAGDLLVVEGNGSPQQIGRAACWDDEIAGSVHQNHLIRVRPGPSLDPRYLALYWNAPHTASILRDVASSTSGLYTLSTTKVKSIPIPLAPLSEQRHIAEVVDQHLETYGRLERSVQRALDRISAVRHSVLVVAFSGQLVHQDPE